jgi:hypothetical protein
MVYGFVSTLACVLSHKLATPQSEEAGRFHLLRTVKITRRTAC